MGIDTVSTRYDGEFPDADALNELLEELQALLVNNGLPSSMLKWPVKAEGPLDMNNNPIINSSSVDGSVRVNSANSLTAAIAAVPAGGTIIIDPGYVANTAAAGDVISADNVTVVSSGGGGINITSRTASGPALHITGANCVIENVVFTEDSAPSNITQAVHFADAVNFKMSGCYFYLDDITNINITAVAVPGGGGKISECTFYNGTATAITGDGADNLHITQTLMTGAGSAVTLTRCDTSVVSRVIAPSGTVSVESSADAVTIEACVANNITADAEGGVVSGCTIYNMLYVDGNQLLLQGNTIETSMWLEPLANARIHSNLFKYNLDMSTIGLGEAESFIGNSCTGTITGLLAGNLPMIANNYASGGIS